MMQPHDVMKKLTDLPDAHLRTFERPDPPSPEDVEEIYLIGVCGTGMGSLAGLLKDAGYAVRGSDAQCYPPMSTRIEEMGVRLLEGFDPAHLDPPPDLVVVGNACTPTHPEAAYAREQGMTQLSFPEALAHFFLQNRRSLVVTGTHGKTTTTGMLVHVLRSAGLDPGFLVGGVMVNGNASYGVGRGPHFVVEGDEYDSAYFDKRPKMMHYRPTSAVVTSMEFDHADIYDDWNDYREAFRRFAGLIREGELLVLNGDDPEVRALAKHTRGRVQFMGLGAAGAGAAGVGGAGAGGASAGGASAGAAGGGGAGAGGLSAGGASAGGAGGTGASAPGAGGSGGPANHVSAADVRTLSGGQQFALVRDGEVLTEVFLPMSGRHNLLNALAVCAIALDEGVTPEQIAAGFATFEGMRRRQEVRAEAAGVLVVDDFAHHPTAVQETARAVSHRWPDRRIIAVFEPRSNSSRRKVFEEPYGTSFEAADRVFLSAPPLRHNDDTADVLDPTRVVEILMERGIPAAAFPSADALLPPLLNELRPGDVALIMSNGSFGGLHDRLIEALTLREQASVQG
jgi:UDP-N-acetylmuramate: L-alanyl-gamma-D-glutamyl-meso-diaminopimelate ligase